MEQIFNSGHSQECIVKSSGYYKPSSDFTNASCFFPNSVIRATGQLQWKNLDKFKDYEHRNVSNKRWGSGILIEKNLFLTAGHCIDPKQSTEVLTPYSKTEKRLLAPHELAPLFDVNFNYQYSQCNQAYLANPSLNQMTYSVKQSVEYRSGGLDYAILELDGNPGEIFGYTKISLESLIEGQPLHIAQHPSGKPKMVDSGRFCEYLEGKQCFTYSINTEPGSSGSGVAINGDTIVGVHITGYDDQVNKAVSLPAINAVSPTIQNIISNQNRNSFFQQTTPYDKNQETAITLGGGILGGSLGYNIATQLLPNNFGAQSLISLGTGLVGGYVANKFAKYIIPKVEQSFILANTFTF